MSAVGSLIFCNKCGNLLDSVNGESKHIVCSQCSTVYDAKKFAGISVITTSAEDAFPSTLRSKKSVVKTAINKNELEEGATIKEKCPSCGHDEMQYHTLQLRSADEGATVFYTCPKCNYKFRTNN